MRRCSGAWGLNVEAQNTLRTAYGSLRFKFVQNSNIFQTEKLRVFREQDAKSIARSTTTPAVLELHIEVPRWSETSSLHRLDLGGTACCVHHTHASLLFWTEAVASVRADELVHCCTLQHRSTGPARSATARRSAGSAAAALHTRTPLLLFSYIFFNRLFSSFLLFNVYAVQCSAVPLCAAPLHCRLCVHAAMLVCSWEERSRRRIPPPLPPPFLFFSRPHSSVAYRTQLQRCTIGARTTTLHQLCSSTIAACVS